MSSQALRLLTYLSAFCGLGVLIYGSFGAVVELLTNLGMLHNRSLWALSHPGDWWVAGLALMTATSIISWLAQRALRSRTTSQQHPA